MVTHSNFRTGILDSIFLFVWFLVSSMTLELDYIYMATAIVGAVSGALVLAYFQRDKVRWEMFLKTGAAALSGLFVGIGVANYLALDDLPSLAVNYFLSAFLSLVILRTILVMMESNAADLFKQILQRVFNLTTKEEKEKKTHE